MVGVEDRLLYALRDFTISHGNIEESGGMLIINGDCIEEMRKLDDNSVDSIVTDPPYELGFMGKSWDSTGIAYNIDVWREALRVLKPGGHMLAFGGTRTYHRMVCAIEDAGFEIRDQMQWLYGGGMPKSMDISKAIDKKLGVQGEVIGERRFGKTSTGQASGWHTNNIAQTGKQAVFAPASDEATQWSGWGTALKPANEPIVVARKPLSEKTVADNVMRWGTGGINIDKGRIYRDPNDRSGWSITGSKESDNRAMSGKNYERIPKPDNDKGRFPANVLFDESAAAILDEQSGTLKSGSNCTRTKTGTFLEHGGLGKAGDMQTTYGDSGGASRFFYCSKASKKERGDGNVHPTVKPLKLMEYLVTLVTPPNGVVLDPFAGSGTTGIAAKNKGFGFVGIEQNDDYCEIARRRID